VLELGRVENTLRHRGISQHLEAFS